MIKVTLKKALAAYGENGMTQKELAERTGIRPASISDIARDNQTSINKEYLSKIMDVLRIEDIRELLEYKKED